VRRIDRRLCVAALVVVLAGCTSPPPGPQRRVHPDYLPTVPSRSAAPHAGSILPSGGPGARAVLAYTACHGCRPVLVLADGRQIDVGEVSGLSPDGRWVLGPGGQPFDIETGVPSTVSEPGVQFDAYVQWSPDSRLLVMTSRQSGQLAAFHVVELATGRRTRIELPPGSALVPTGVLPTGEVVARPEAVPSPDDPARMQLTVLGAGGRRRTITVDAAGTLRPDEILSWQLRLGAGGTAYALAATAGGSPTAVLPFSLADGHVLGRWELAGQVRAPTGFGWQPHGYEGAEVILHRITGVIPPTDPNAPRDEGGHTSDSYAIEVALMNPGSGAIRPVCHLPSTIRLALRGDSRLGFP
jgi:hypothetical protein